jgi:hypothetical protein
LILASLIWEPLLCRSKVGVTFSKWKTATK